MNEKKQNNMLSLLKRKIDKLEKEVRDLKEPLEPQIFTANPNQTIFTPTLHPNSRTQAESGGSIYSVGTGISIVEATVVFDAAFDGGETVLIRNLR